MRAPAARSGGAAGVSHDSPRTPNVHISGSRPSKTPTTFNEKTPRERKKNENCGGRREKKERNFGRSGGGLSGGGLSGGGLSSGLLSSGLLSSGLLSSGNGVQGSGFRVKFRCLGTKTETA